ncbi:hypothetical protein [Streptomyces sp. NPDC053720]|uniref:hypothetical protein n=1 Tax=Streptomyces sp. NPDC053720 TaxID=3154855 RepID=UPI00341CE37A
MAVGTLVPDDDRVKAVLLVEDPWQNHGLGTMLLRHLGGHAVHQGWREVYGLVLPSDERILAVLRRTAIPVQRVEEEGVMTVRADTGDIAGAPRFGEADTAADPDRRLVNTEGAAYRSEAAHGIPAPDDGRHELTRSPTARGAPRSGAAQAARLPPMSAHGGGPHAQVVVFSWCFLPGDDDLYGASVMVVGVPCHAILA